MSTKMVHQITSGIAGWRTYEQMRNGVDNLTEGSLYKPIEEIARGRRFEVKHEFPIPKDSPGCGGPKEDPLCHSGPQKSHYACVRGKIQKTRQKDGWKH